MKEILEKLDVVRENLSHRDVVCFTVDIDWASEYACQQTLRFFEEHGIPITVFLTHPSKVLDEALHAGKIRGGLHPNFMPDSSQKWLLSLFFLLDLCALRLLFRQKNHSVAKGG